MLRKEQFLPLFVVLVAVLLNIGSAVILKTLTNQGAFWSWIVLIGIFFVAFLNGLRFLVWGFVHNKYPLSMSYPLSSIFYPLMLGVSYAYGDPIYSNQIIGTALITAGVLWITLRIKP